MKGQTMIGGGGRWFDGDPRRDPRERDEDYGYGERQDYGRHVRPPQDREPLFDRSFGFGGGRSPRPENREPLFGRGFGLGVGGADRAAYDRSARAGRDAGPHHRDILEKATDEVSSWFGDDAARRRRDMDHLQETHQGRGPKGYRRSDSRIREDASDRLSDDPVIDASELELSVHEGEITLTGYVRSRSDKRRAEDLLERISGVVHVQNNLRVNPDEQRRDEDRRGYDRFF